MLVYIMIYGTRHAECDVSDTAKIFMTGRSQAVRLPLEYRFENCSEVHIRRDPDTGDVILSRRPQDWESFLRARDEANAAGEVPADFLDNEEPNQDLKAPRDPFGGWKE